MSVAVGKLLSDPIAVTSIPVGQADADVESMAFADLLGRLEADVPLPDANWSSAGLPVRAHARRFDETSLLALAAAIGAGAPVPETVPDVLGQSPGVQATPAQALPAEQAGTATNAPAPEGDLVSANFAGVARNGRPSISATTRKGAFIPVATRNTSFGTAHRLNGLVPGGGASEPEPSIAPRTLQADGKIEQDAPARAGRARPIFREMVQAQNLASHAVQVAICALESGLRVVVKAHGTEIGESAELQRAVLSLLAEHGFSQTEIVVFGPKHQYPSGGR